MRVAIINLTGGNLSGGYLHYLENILPGLAHHPAISALLCAVPRAQFSRVFRSGLPKTTFIPCKKFLLPGWQIDRELKRELDDFQPDLIFIPLARPFKYNNIPVVTMLQNMAPLASPVKFLYPLKERLRYFIQYHLARHSLKNSQKIIAVSHFVKDFLIRKWRLHEKSIRVIYYGVPEYHNGNSQQRPAPLPESWKSRFIFSAGSIQPYRGLEDLISALPLLKNSISSEQPQLAGLVIAGAPLSGLEKYARKLKEQAKKLNPNLEILWFDHLNKKEMSWCYSNSALFVMSSRIESIGMVGLEALEHGVPIISVKNPPLPEIFADAALYYDAGSPEQLAKQINLITEKSTTELEALRLNVKKRAQNFSWSTTVQRTVELFEETLSDK